MVLPTSEISMRQQYRKLHKRSKLALAKTLSSNEYQAEARQLAKQAAEQARERLYLDGNIESCDVSQSTTSRRRINSIEFTTSSVVSAEVAVERGSLKAQEEISEWIGVNTNNTPFGQSHSDDDLATLDEENTINGSRNLNRGKKKSLAKSKDKTRLLARSKNSKKTQVSSKRNDITKEAWMCGCCGKVFSTFKTAEVHENKCIQNTVTRMGYCQQKPLYEDKLVPLKGLDQSHTDDDFEELSTDFKTTRRLHDITPKQGQLRPLKMSRISSEPLSILKAPAISRHSRAISDGMEIQGSHKFISKQSLVRSFADGDILMTTQMRKKIIVTDQALVNTVNLTVAKILSSNETRAEIELNYLAKSKKYYDMMVTRACHLKKNPLLKFRTDGKDLVSRVKNKFVDAYQLVKEGDLDNQHREDQYGKTARSGDDEPKTTLVHHDGTAYVNVVVKHSIRVVNSELERLARQRWEDQNQGSEKPADRFEQFRKFAHGNLVKLATIALASDFTPRRVAVQLSNDLYRLMVPQLKRRGVVIETEIEYRVGPYFVLAVNIKSIRWLKLMKYSHKAVLKARKVWREEQARRDELHEDTAKEDEEEKKKAASKELGAFGKFLLNMRGLLNLTSAEIIAQILAWLYWVHWTISVPICWIFFGVLCRTKLRNFILSTVTDEIFSYVEEKGMEMEIRVQTSRRQAAFMLSALREIREDSRELKKKRQEGEAGQDKGTILGPLLGPAIKFDKGPTPPIPDGFEVPDNLEFVGLEVDLPVGFKRLRWAMLSKDSQFVKDAIFAAQAKYENITFNEWSKHGDIIGSSDLPDGLVEDDVVGAELETSYLMPKSAFVKANTAYETNTITAYNDYCFCIKKRTLTPEVPYGSTFVAWTQLVIVNTGNDTCRMVCSTEAEFPNGPPMISRQIQSGMRAGTALLFVLIGETICKYADEFP